MKAVEIFTIKNKIPLFKGEEKAERIELIELEEVGFHVVSAKDLYQIGDKAVFIQPDYNLSDISLFESFIKPNGDESKSMLGKVEGLPRRIRAKKFNFHTGNGIPVYSNGILLPLQEVCEAVPSFMSKGISFDEALGITKYEEPDEKIKGNGVKGGGSSKFPEGIIRTDEENFNNLVRNIENILPKKLVGRVKVDGSSITLWYKDGKSGIASRNLGKPIHITKVTGRRAKTLLEKLMFWKKVDLNVYEKVLNDSDFVKYGHEYLQRLESHCKAYKVNLILQGELCGRNLKGSGNKNNPHSKEKPDILFFNVCEYKEQSVRLDEQTFQNICYSLNLPSPPVIFNQNFNTIEEIEEICENYFKDNLVEGIVIRDEFHNLSTKYMNSEYDSKK
jgi:hypothetical protein